MSEPSVTIPVMVYRNADALPRTTESILRLDLTDPEVLLSDDGSPEDQRHKLEAAAEQLRKKYRRVRVIVNEENVGTVRHFNGLIDRAEGDYIVPCSAGDSFADAATLRLLAERMERRGELILSARHRDLYPDRVKVRPGALFGMMQNRLPKTALRSMITKRNQISGCAVIYTKKLFESFGKFDEDYRLLDDFPYYVMLLKRGVKFPYVHRVLTEHPMGGVSNGSVHPQIYRDIRTMRRKLLADPAGLDGRTLEYLKKTVKEENDGD